MLRFHFCSVYIVETRDCNINRKHISHVRNECGRICHILPDFCGNFYRPPDKSAYLKIIFIISQPNICCGYSKNDRHTLPDSANGRVTDNKILFQFVSVHMRFLSVPHALNAFRVR